MEVEYPSCGLCGAKECRELMTVFDKRHGNPGEFKIVECTRCTLRYLRPRPKETMIGAFYPETYPAYQKRDTSRFRIVSTLNLIFDAYQRVFLSDSYPVYYFTKNAEKFNTSDRPPRILDVGCGSGQKLVHLKKAGWDTYGIDFDKRAVANAVDVGAGQVEVAEGGSIPFGTNYFEAVMSWHSLEHHYEPKQTLHEMFRVLSPGGYAIVAVPSGDNVGLNIFGANWGPLEAPRHLYHFTERTLSLICCEAGFEIVRFFYDFTFYGLFLDQEIFESLENIAASHGFTLRFPRITLLSSLSRILVLPFNGILGNIWKGSNLIIHLRKPEFHASTQNRDQAPPSGAASRSWPQKSRLVVSG